MKLKIYLDMDGVLTNFDKQYVKVNGIEPSLARRDTKGTDNYWDNFVLGKNFEKLDYFPGAELLLKVIKTLAEDKAVSVEILSSSGGPKYHDEVASQKVKWLKDHNIKYKANIVSGRSKKKDYADKNTVLIDDTADVIESFTKAGGQALLHKDVYVTIEKLMKIYKTFKDSL